MKHSRAKEESGAKTAGYFQAWCWNPSPLFWQDKSIRVIECWTAPKKNSLTGLNHNQKRWSAWCSVHLNNLPILGLTNKLRPTCSLLSLREAAAEPLQRPLSKVGNRRETVAGPLDGVPTREAAAAAGSLRRSDGDAAAAAAFAVKFMLIESEAAATSTSFLPAQFSHLLFLWSSQPGCPPPPTSTLPSTPNCIQLCTWQTKKEGGKIATKKQNKQKKNLR